MKKRSRVTGRHEFIRAVEVLEDEPARKRVTIQYSTAEGTSNREEVSFDSVLQPITISFPSAPQTTSSELLGIHLQLDNWEYDRGVHRLRGRLDALFLVASPASFVPTDSAGGLIQAVAATHILSSSVADSWAPM
jgi:hypothetical protein